MIIKVSFYLLVMNKGELDVMGQIYFHIGMSKTGTSAIQAFLTLSEKALKNNNFLFPNPPDLENEQAFQTTAGNGLEIYSLIKNNKEKELDKLLKEYKKSKYDVIISTEMLIPAFIINNELSFNMIKKYNIKIIVYIRNQSDFVESDYNQRVKNHGMFEEININKGKQYYLLIEKLIDNMKNENLIIRPYEKCQFKDENIFSDFLDCLNLNLTDEYTFPEQIVNPSLSTDVLHFKKTLNSVPKYYFEDLTPELIEINKQLLEYVVYGKNEGEAFKDKNILTQDNIDKINIMYSKYNEKVAKFIGKEKLFEKNNTKSMRISEVNIDTYLKISKYILQNINSKKAEEYYTQIVNDIKKVITTFTADAIVDNIQNYNLDYSGIRNSKFEFLYKLSELPVVISDSVGELKYNENKLYIESKGNDPFFLLPNFVNLNSKKLLIKFEIDSNSESFIEIFYANEIEGFNPNNRVKYKIEKGINSFFVFIEHEQTINKVRIDMGEIIASYTVNNIEVYNQY